MKRLLPLVLLAAVASARADRLINTPIASKLTAGSVRYEQMFGLGSGTYRRESLLYAYDQTFEFEARHIETRGHDDTTVDVYATLISPFKGYAPGIAVGVRDALGTTSDGLRPWVAVTFREPYQVGELERGADITIGGFFGRSGGALIALSIPFGPDLRLLAEHDGIRLSSGIQYSPIRRLELRLVTQSDQRPTGAIRYSLRF